MIRRLVAAALLLGLCVGSTSMRANARERALSFRVTADTPTLSAVALYLYGKPSMYRAIARWNRLRAPYKIRVGRVLTLRAKPRLSPEQGAAKLLAMWRKRFGLSDGNARRELAQVGPPNAQVISLSSLSPQELVLRGEQELNSGDFKAAADLFHRCRERDPEYLPAWFLELRTLKQLKADDKIPGVVSALLGIHPELRDAPVISRYIGGSDPP